MNFQVIKVDGTREPYSEAKIRASATRVGVPRTLQDKMLREVRSKLYDGIKTREIFQIITRYLKHSRSPHLSAKFNLKEALAQLGPSGYPFEQYLSLLLEAQGYQTQTNQVLQGRCVAHEVDVVAKKDGLTHFVEAKFHRQASQRSDIKVALYIQARYEDLSAAIGGSTAPWLITNTRFSSDVITYGKCRHLQLTSWSYPRGHSLMEMIEATQLHPITILDLLTREDKQRLAAADIVTCRQLARNPQAARLVPSSRRQAVISQAAAICATHSE